MPAPGTMDNLETAKCWGREDGRSKLARIVPADHEFYPLFTTVGALPGKAVAGEKVHKLDVSQCIHCKEIRVQEVGVSRVNL